MNRAWHPAVSLALQSCSIENSHKAWAEVYFPPHLYRQLDWHTCCLQTTHLCSLYQSRLNQGSSLYAHSMLTLSSLYQGRLYQGSSQVSFNAACSYTSCLPGPATWSTTLPLSSWMIHCLLISFALLSLQANYHWYWHVAHHGSSLYNCSHRGWVVRSGLTAWPCINAWVQSKQNAAQQRMVTDCSTILSQTVAHPTFVTLTRYVNRFLVATVLTGTFCKNQ